MSSSEEEEEEVGEAALATTGLADDQDDCINPIGAGFINPLGGSTLALAMQNNPNGASSNQASKRPSQQSFQQQQADISRPASRQQLYNLPTLINVTAPSPMGSVRDVSRQQLASPSDEPQLFTTIGGGGGGGTGSGAGSTSRCSSPSKRHSHQDVLAYDQLIGKTGQMSLGPSPGSSRRSIASCVPEPTQPTSHHQRTRVAHRHCDSSDDLLTMGSLRQDLPTSRQHDEGDEEQGQLQQQQQQAPHDDESRSKLIDELLKTINDDSFNEFIDFNNKLIASTTGSTSSQPDQMDSNSGGQLADLVNASRPKSALGGADGAARYSSSGAATGSSRAPPRTLNASLQAASNNINNKSSGGRSPGQARGSICVTSSNQQQPSTFDNVIRRMSTNFVQNFNKMSSGTLGAGSANDGGCNTGASADMSSSGLRREKSSAAAATTTYSNSLYVDTQVPARRHSDNTINVPRIQVGLSSPSSSGSRTNLNQRASLSASKLATKWKMNAKTSQRESSDKLSPNLGGALGYIRRHSSGNTQGGGNEKGGSGGGGGGSGSGSNSSGNHDQGQSNGLGAQLLNAASPFKVSVEY